MILLAISIIQEYQDEHLFEPKLNWWKEQFSKRCYERWAAEELISRFIKQETVLPWNAFYQESKTPIEVIVEFMDEMDEFLEIGNNEQHHSIFQIAKETATDILCLFL